MAKRKKSPGFTLVELMVVITIIGILAAVGIPRLVAYISTAQTSEAAQIGGRILESVRGYVDSRLNPVPASIATDLDLKILDPVPAASTVTTLIPHLSIPADAVWTYTIHAAVATGGPFVGDVVSCIVAIEKDGGSVAESVLISSTRATTAGWEGNINRVAFVSGNAAVDGGYCTGGATPTVNAGFEAAPAP